MVLPVVLAISQRFPERTVFTRFITPQHAEDMPGTWRLYYEKWRQTTRERLDVRLLQLMPDLGKLVPPASVIDKTRYSAFFEPDIVFGPGRRIALSLRAPDDRGGCRPWISRDPRPGRRLQFLGRRARCAARALPSSVQHPGRNGRCRNSSVTLGVTIPYYLVLPRGARHETAFGDGTCRVMIVARPASSARPLRLI